MTKDSLLNRFDDLLNEYVSELDLDALKKVDEEYTLFDGSADYEYPTFGVGLRFTISLNQYLLQTNNNDKI
jgi:hypothetical protein